VSDDAGTVVADNTPGFTPFGYAGGMYENQTRLVRFGARDCDAASGRWTSRDPVLFSGGVANIWTYVGANPTNRADPRGLWSEDAHNALLEFALEGYASSPQIERLQQVSKEFDESTQGSKQSHMHSMARSGEPSYSAIARRNSFVNVGLRLARYFRLSGECENALKYLGESLHTIMDSSSPLQVDPQGNPKEWRMFELKSLKHGFWEWTTSEGVNDITREIYLSQGKKIFDAFNYVFR
jgi:RHS repeat-associated protein